MTISDRNQAERAMLADGGGLGFERSGRRVLAAYTVLAAALLAVLLVGAVQVFDGWPLLLLIGALAVCFVAIAVWIHPRGRGVG